ncbi:MAG: DegT/DnrJ/EryC1/StrS family aminotransferase [Nanoarchaeota archaeon]
MQPLNIRMFSPYIADSCAEAVTQVLDSRYIGEGPKVAALEKAIKDRLNIPFPVALNSGTAAIHLALVMAGVKAGDEVITTAQTMMATSHAILAQQATPVFADIQYENGNIDPKDIGHRITPKTKAILVVHWTGYPCDMDEITEIAKKHSLLVIEDAAHALGATYKGRPIGAISPYTAFSLQAIKHITTGDGGMLSLTDKAKYDEARRRRWYGIDRENRKPSEDGEPIWDVTEVGYKYHMNDIAASIGLENMKHFSELFAQRKSFTKQYHEALKDISGITLMTKKDDRESANWLFALHVERRLDFIRMLKEKGIEASVVHNRIDTNAVFGGIRDLPQLERYTKTHVCLPLHNSLTKDDIQTVIDAIKGGW